MHKSQKTKEKYASLGLCVYCGKNTPESDKRGCNQCNEKKLIAVKKTKIEHPEKVKNWQNRSNQNRRQHRINNGLCVQCGIKSENKICHVCKEYHANAAKIFRIKHSEKIKQKEKQRRQKIRKEVIDKYGGVCDCCNEHRLEFLAIDHKNRDGNVERKKINGKNVTCTSSWYGKLKKEPKRDDLRVLCHNCNLSIGFYGYCPHTCESHPVKGSA